MLSPLPDPFTPGLLTWLPESPRRVAVMRASRLGDFLCATPAFRALRAALPNAKITLIALPYVRDLAARSASFDHFAPFPGFPGIAEQLFDAPRTLAFLQRMQAQRFDLAIQLHGSGVYSNPFTLLLGAEHTAGFMRAGDAPGRLDAALPLPTVGHEIHRTLALPTFLGAPNCGDAMDYPLWPEDNASAEALLADTPRPLIGLHPAASDLGKRWSLAAFATAGIALQRRYGGTLVLLGNRASLSDAQSVAAGLYGPSLNLTGRTTLGALGAVIARLSLLITNDTGPAHIAYALHTPSITLFRDTDPAQWGPLHAGPHRVLVGDIGVWETLTSRSERIIATATYLLGAAP